MRKAAGDLPDRERHTDNLLNQIQLDLQGATSGSKPAARRLEAALIAAQQYAHLNPFVSCSLSRSVAQGFALAGDTDGYLLTLDAPIYAGLDFEETRRRLGLTSWVFDYLEEWGIPKEVSLPPKPPITLISVERVSLVAPPIRLL